MEGAAVLETRHEVAPFISLAMVCDVLQAVLPLISVSDISELHHADSPDGLEAG
jgi:hypothetical protein